MALDLLVQWLPTVALLVVTVVMVWREPRRMRCAIFAGLTLTSAYFAVQPALFARIGDDGTETSAWVLLAGVGFALALVLVVTILLIWAGVVLLSREGVGVAHSLSLLLGVAMLIYVAASIIAVLRSDEMLVVYLLLVGLPIALFGFILVAYLQYSALYGWWARHWAKPGEVVVVLGSGLIGDRVPPLLARRLDLGLAMYEKSLRVWRAPVLVVSGGKGSDEVMAEGEAMARYVEKRGMPEVGELIVEDRSASTEENLEFSRTLVQDRGSGGPWMAVTSDFHGFRAAMLMCAQGIPGNAVGARSARYFWASAKLREFIAILAMFPKWTVAAIVVSMAPLALMAVTRLLSLLALI